MNHCLSCGKEIEKGWHFCDPCFQEIVKRAKADDDSFRSWIYKRSDEIKDELVNQDDSDEQQ